MLNKQQIKEHIIRHKVAYSCAVTGVGVAGITWVIMREMYNQPIGVGNVADATGVGNVAVAGKKVVDYDANPTYWEHHPMQIPPTGNIGFSFSNSDIQHSFNDLVVNVVERDGRGHPGYMVRCVETGLTYLSQKQAAIAHNVHQNRISDHLNGRLNDVDGYHFERIYMAA